MQENLNMNENMTGNIDILFSNIENFTQKEGVLGKPVTQEGKTFIPVVSISVGFGGGNTANKNQSGDNTTGKDKWTSGTTVNMAGGALGLGARVTTDAIVVIDNGNVSMMTLGAAGTASSIIEKLPEMVKGMNQNQQ